MKATSRPGMLTTARPKPPACSGCGAATIRHTQAGKPLCRDCAKR